MQRTLYNIGLDVLAIDDLVMEAYEDRESITDEEQETIDNFVKEIFKNQVKKLEDYGYLIVQADADAKSFAEEENRLRAKKQAYLNKRDRLKNSVFEYMKLTGTKKKKAGNITFTVCKNGGKSPLLASILPEALPEKYQVIRIDPNNDAIRKDLEDGQVVEGMELGERGSHVRVK